MANVKDVRFLSRRDALVVIGGSMLLPLAPRLVKASDALRFKSDPFKLGVASGSSTPTGVVLWTRIIGDGLEQTAVPVRWEISTDEHMRKIEQRGVAYATAEWAHSIHVEVTALKPGHEYWYRFIAGEHASSVGRTRTLPAITARPERLRIAVACCQKFETGFFTSYPHMMNDNLDFIMHVGDYIYEYEVKPGLGSVRWDGSEEATTLEDYRARYALYRSDLDLQAAHAAHPWLVTWDDHEVANDYAGDTSYDQSGEGFLARRAAAYRAYYEHMPLRRSAIPVGPNMRRYDAYKFGALAQVHMLDSRQHRSPLACLGEGESDGPGARCTALFAAARTKLGQQQEQWLSAELKQSRATWNVMAWGTPIAHVDLDPGPGVAYRRDSWDGYPAARQRFLDTLQEIHPNNPIVINGDIHAFQVANLNRQADDLQTPVIASEFTATSVTSQGVSQRALDERRKWNPNVLLSDATRRGYLLMEFSRDRLQTDLVTVDTIKEREAKRGLTARYVVESGKPGPQLV